MNKQRFVRKLVAAAVLAAFGASEMALATEVEPNHPISSAQRLTITGDDSGKGSSVVMGSISHVNNLPDVDFYSFYAEAGDIITIDIDGTARYEDGGLDSFITLFGPMSSMPFENDDSGLMVRDEGSISDFDSLIADFPITQSGIYTIAVTAYGTWLSPTGTYETTSLPETSGAYTLVVSGARPAPEEPKLTYIDINVKPGSIGRTPIDTKAGGVIPVALMSSQTFNALDVDVKSLTFGRTGNELSLRSCAMGGEDVNRDGRTDLVCHFDNQRTGFVPGDLVGFMKGKTREGAEFEGRGSIKAKPEKPGRS